MNPSVAQRASILTALAVAMAATRLHHFAAIPDASWAVFFIGGYYLRDWSRWAFPALMALAVVVDWLVIRSQGLDFWRHYCVSPAYWALVPAYFALWGGGMWLRRQGIDSGWRALGLLAASLVASVAVCHLLAQGSFYWLSSSVAAPTLAGWWKNYSDWLPPYLGVASMYTGLVALAHVALAKAGAHGLAPPQRR
ncbi:hypothetical protein [Luteimonas vadosa]|uniref:Cobalamin ABC transporter n=1 Tax=Luteimonas vadosa TaxID=1165507 RepID=A0ABP9EC96_9GAMM